jgi:hypothetical protein
MRSEISARMKQELRTIIEEERMAKLQDQATSPSKFQQENTLPSSTPQREKAKGEGEEGGFLLKTSSQIFSSVKKIISKNVQTIKNIVPKFMKSAKKCDKLKICNYDSQFSELFKIEKNNSEEPTLFVHNETDRFHQAN